MRIVFATFLAVNASMTFGQPQAYYKILLHGRKVDAGLGHQSYLKILREIKGELIEPEFVALADGDEDLALDDLDDIDIDGGDRPIEDLPRPRPKCAARAPPIDGAIPMLLLPLPAPKAYTCAYLSIPIHHK